VIGFMWLRKGSSGTIMWMWPRFPW